MEIDQLIKEIESLTRDLERVRMDLKRSDDALAENLVKHKEEVQTLKEESHANRESLKQERSA